MATRIARAAALIGVAVVVTTSVIGGSGFSASLLLFVAYALVPYALLGWLGIALKDPWAVSGAGAAALAVEIGIRLSVFVFPRGSTAAIALVFSPAFIAAIAMPAGGIAGFVVGRAMASGRAWLQASALAVGVVGLGLIVLGFARPDLFPTTVIARQRSIDRFGPPRVVVGRDTFTRTGVSDRSSWVQTGDFDGKPGDEIAIVDHRLIELVDASDFSRRQRIDVRPGALHWNWFTRFARADDRLLVVDTGGGYSETEVRTMDGAQLWRYHPDTQLPPTALVPQDLDGDGNAELYAATGAAIVRLDAVGREVWRQQAVLPRQILVAPPIGVTPGWVATVDQTQSAVVWDASGVQLGSVKVGMAPVLGIVDFPTSRALAVGGSSLRLIGLDGRASFEWTIEDASFVEVVTVRFEPDRQRLLAVVAAAPRDVHRWRLQIVSADRDVAYDEIFDTSVRLLTARTADGREILLLKGDSRLDALGPKSASNGTR